MLCSNAAKTQNPLKFVGVPRTPEPISAVSGPKEEVLMLKILRPLRLGEEKKKKKKKERKKKQDENIMVCSIT